LGKRNRPGDAESKSGVMQEANCARNAGRFGHKAE
jgi:hypothetical protein